MAGDPLSPLTPDELGIGAPPVGPMAPPPTVQSFMPHQNLAQKLGPVAAALATIFGGKALAGAPARGYMQGQQAVDQSNLQHAQIAQQDAIRQQQFAQQQAMQEQRRQQALSSAMGTIKQRVGAIKDKSQYDQEIDAYASMLQQSGYRINGNQLRVSAPFIAPSAKQIAGDAVNAWLKNPANAAAIRKDPTIVGRAILRIDTNGDGVPENVPLMRAGELGGIQFAEDETGKPLALQTDDKIGDKFKELYGAKLQRFIAENKRQPEPAEKEKLIKAAVAEGAEVARKPDTLPQIANNDQVDRAAMAIIENKMAPSQAAQLYGGMGTAAGAFKRAMTDRVRQLKPDFNFAEAESNYQFGKNAGTQTTVRYIDNIAKTIPMLRTSSQAFKRSNIQIVNGALQTAETQLGGVNVADFNFKLTLLADEIAKVLQGGGTGSATSDAKLKQAQSLLDGRMSTAQLDSVLNAAEEMLSVRRASLTEGTHMQKPVTPAAQEEEWVRDGSGRLVKKGAQ